MARYLFWDFDGTLAWRDGKWMQVLLELLRDHGQEDITAEQLRPRMRHGFPWHEPEVSHAEFFAGRPWWERMNAYFAAQLMELGLERGLAQEVAAGVRGRYLDLEKWHLYEDAHPALRRAAELGWRNVILSNHVPELDLLVDGLGLRGHFYAVFTSGLVGYEKPNPAFFERAARALGDVEDAVMVGDNPAADVRGALDAGFGAVLVRRDNDAGYEQYSADLLGVFSFVQRRFAGGFPPPDRIKP